jgi:HK97 family phage prohead protease
MDLCYGAPLPVGEFKAAGDSWEVSGYASTFGNVDFGGDVVMHGAFDDWLTGWKAGTNKTRFLFSHQSSMILGRPTEMKVDNRGLFVRAKISKTQLGADVHTLLQDQALESFSIGYIPTDVEFDDSGARKLKTISLPEFSLVAMPMNSEAVVTGFKHDDGAKVQSVKSKYCPECGMPQGASQEHKAGPIDLNTQVPFEELCTQIKGHLMYGMGEAEALHARRLEDQRELSQAHIDALVVLQQELKGSDERIAAILNAASPPEVKANGALSLHIDLANAKRRARERDRARLGLGAITP